MPVPLIAWGLVALGGLLLSSCGDDKPEEIDPLEPPGPQPEDPPGTIYDCLPPEDSFLLAFRGYGAQSLVRVRDAQGQPITPPAVTPGESRDGCFVMSVNRLGPAESAPLQGGISYWTEGRWSNAPSPFLDFDDLHFGDAVTLLNGRGLEQPLNNLFRGYPGDPIRLEGSWGTVFGLAGLPELGPNASLAWLIDMTINSNTCQAELGLWQAVRRPDGLEAAPETEDLLVLPFYREEACDFSSSVGTEVQTITLCDDATSNPCETLGGTELTKLDVTLFALPIGTNPQDVQDDLQNQEDIVAGALPTFEDEWPVIGNASGNRRPSFQVQLPRRARNP